MRTQDSQSQPATTLVIMFLMTDVTQILNAIEKGDPSASDKLLPLVYEELRVLARQRLSQENAGQTLQATALVHEAYLRLVGTDNDQNWDNRGHFFSAAAEAMRRILVDSARRKKSVKHGGQLVRQELEPSQLSDHSDADDLIALDEALEKLAAEDPDSAELVKLRYFAGLTVDQSARVIGVSSRKADFMWSFARTWLRRAIK